jgi:predicted RecB family nuclease
MDAFSNPKQRDEISPFVRMLWERGSAWEEKVVSSLGVPFVDLSPYSLDEKERLTTEAMQRREPLILGCRISADDLLGDPDLLRLEGGGYVPIDIKSGRGEEGGSDEDDPKPKKHYAVQLGLYLDILERKGVAGGRHGYIWDGHGEEVRYDFDETYGVRNPRTPWQDYRDALGQAQSILSAPDRSQPAYASGCKLCWWYSSCLKALGDADDLTLVPELGRKARDAMVDTIPTVGDLAAMNPDGFISKDKTPFPGIGEKSLRKFHARASLIKSPSPQPRLTNVVRLPSSPLELFLDIEVDPMQDVCYLHGFVERRNGDNTTERFIAFFADEPTPEAEESAFRRAWDYFRANSDAAIYYYSKYERTIYRKLQEKYPHVCSADDVEALFDPARAVDLYFDVVQPATIWPTKDHSIKTLAKFLGFDWRDTNPSGAASIEWYARWCETRDPAIKEQILEYNEDDCRATRVLLDGIRAL